MAPLEKYEAVRRLLEAHNQVLDSDQGKITTRIDVDATINAIKLTGGTDDDSLKKLSYEEITSLIFVVDNSEPPKKGRFKDVTGLTPTALCKRIRAIFRPEDEDQKGPPTTSATRVGIADQKPIKPKHVDMMSLRELVQNFVPANASSAIGKRLKSESEGKPFLVYRGDKVDVDKSVDLLTDLKSGYPPLTITSVSWDPIPQKVYAVGDLPNNEVDENPIYKGRALRSGGECCQLGRSWNGVPLNVRQLVRLAIESGELHADHIQGAHEVMDKAIASNAFESLCQRCRKAAVEYQKRERDGTLPRLKVELSKQPVASGLSGGKKVS